MGIQNLSIVVPTKGCVCKCKTCVSRIHGSQNDYPNNIELAVDEKTWHYKEDYRKRLEFARDNGCNTLILTGAPGEPLQNIEFLKKLSEWNYSLRKPFYCQELQTTGVLLTSENLKILRDIGVSTITLSNFNIFDDEDNFDVMQAGPALKYDVKMLCHQIKEMGFNLRIALNLTKAYETISVREMINRIFDKLVEYNVDQVTLRQLYMTDQMSPINDYIRANGLSYDTFKKFYDLINANGNQLEVLPFGAIKFSYRNISTVLDDDCMARNHNESIRYLILRENCKLYTKWNFKSSIIF